MLATAAADWGDEVRALHPFARVYEDVLEAGLSIVNPAVHSGPCLLSVTAIENSAKRPFFLYEHGITPASCRLNVQIDNERKAIGRKLGYALTPIEDFTGLREGYTWQELYMSIHGNIALTPIAGPHEITSRYFTEDAPFGLVPWSELGRAAGVATPTIDAILDVYGVLHERDWRSTGRKPRKPRRRGAVDRGAAGLRENGRRRRHLRARPRLIGQRAGAELRLALVGLDRLAADRADAVIVQLAAAARVAQHDRWAVGRRVLVAPLQQRDEDRPEVDALARQPVLEALRALLVAHATQHVLVDKALKPRLQDVARHAEVALEVVEATGAEERVAQDQQRPALPDELERARDRAVLAFVCVPKHSCMILRTC
jgi:hypothetical protein